MNLKYKVKILVEPTYLEDHSDPAEDSYLWAYTVKIKNNSYLLIIKASNLKINSFIKHFQKMLMHHEVCH